MRVPGPCLRWNSQVLAKCQPFLRPLCGSKVTLRKPQVIIGTEEACGAQDDHHHHPTPHYTLFYWPHTPCANHTSHFPSVRRLPVCTPFSFCSPPPIWQCQAPHLPSCFPSFPACPSIYSVSTPSVLSAWAVRMNGSTGRQVRTVFRNMVARWDCVATAMVKIWGTKLLMRQSTKQLWYGSTVDTESTVILFYYSPQW